jgi:hypothetical protein
MPNSTSKEPGNLNGHVTSTCTAANLESGKNEKPISKVLFWAFFQSFSFSFSLTFFPPSLPSSLPLSLSPSFLPSFLLSFLPSFLSFIKYQIA